MDSIAGLETRIVSALGRVAAALDRLGPQGTASISAAEAAPPGELAEALAAERAAHAALSDRVQALRARQDATVAGLETRIAALTEENSSQAREIQRLRDVCLALSEALEGLRAESGIEAAAIEKSMAAELAALYETRSAEIAELNAIIAVLEPIVSEAERTHAGA
jgi:chromosome segregation ATPase